MKYNVFIFRIILLAYAIFTSGQNVKAQAVGDWIESSGTGETEEKATMQALRNVIQQQVGTYIDAETIVANEAVMKDEILDYSAGFVEDYERLGISVNKGVTEVRIRAKVRADKLHQRITEAFKAATKVDGQKIFQVASTMQEKDRDALTLLRTVASEFPEKAIAIEVATPRTLRTFSDGSVEVGLRARFSMAPDFVARLQNAVHAVSPKYSKLNSLSQVMTGWEDVKGVKYTGAVFGSGGQYEFCALSTPHYWAIIAAMMSGDRYIWPQAGMGTMWFRLDARFADNQFPSQIQPRLRINLLDKDGGVIGAKDFDAFGDIKWLSPQAASSEKPSQGPGWWYFAEGLVRFVYYDTSWVADNGCPPEPVDLSRLPGVPSYAKQAMMATVPPAGVKYQHEALVMINSSASKEREYKWRIPLDDLKHVQEISAYYVSPLKQRDGLAPLESTANGDAPPGGLSPMEF